ncbi:hypothetical protein IMZ48_02055 [Candidatus Bathyarchaeota archaeon]|nr:hypothetical protein [Candidatus Bathyarchaeota archaeon]
MPRRAFSPPSFSSTASSRTMFRKTYSRRCQQLVLRKHHGIGKGSTTHIVSPENANDLAASVQLHE